MKTPGGIGNVKAYYYNYRELRIILSRTLKLVLSGEFAFAVFLTSGAFKEVIPAQFIDLTILMLIISILITIKRLLFKKNITKLTLISIGIYFILLIVVSMSMLYSPSLYAVDKYIRFTVLTSWAFFGGLLMVLDKGSLKKLIDSICLISIFCSVLITYSFMSGDYVGGFIGVSDGNYLGSARVLGLGVLSLLVLFVYNNINISKKSIILIGLILVSLAILVTGARMPIISLIFSSLTLLIISIRFVKGKIIIKKGTKVLGILGVGLIPFIYYFKDTQLTETLFRRIEVLLYEGGASAIGRVDRYTVAIDIIKNNFFLGKGFGSFGLSYLGSDVREYPHNIFLELAAESGVISVITFVVLLIMSVIKSKNFIFRSNYQHAWIFSSLLFLLLNSLVSGDLNDNRALFALVGIAIQSKMFEESDISTSKDTTVTS